MTKWIALLLTVLVVSAVAGTDAITQEDAGRPGENILQVLGTLRVGGSGGSAEDGPYAGIPQSRLEDGGFLLGDPDAPVVIVEFADFMCPHCQDYEEITDRFINTYVATGQAAFEYRMVPIVSEVLSPLTAQAAECAGDAGLFWEARRLLFVLAKERVVDENIAQLTAERLGLDATALEACMSNARQFLADAQLAGSLGVSGTPAVMVRVRGSQPQWVSIQGQVFDRGGLPYELLEQVMLSIARQSSGG